MILEGSYYARPGVELLGVAGRDGVTRVWVMPPVRYRREDFTRGRVHTFRQGDEIDALAAVEYGNSLKWRVIADVNDLVDVAAIPVGTELFLPSPEEVP